MTEKSTPATNEVLADKKTRLEKVHAKRAAVEQQLPSLKNRAARARELVHEAKLASEVALGTVGFEDDLKAAASVKRALAEQEAAGLALDEAEDQLQVLDKGSKQLKLEVDQLTTRLQQEHLARCKVELEARVEAGKAGVLAFLSDVTALRGLGGQPTWEQELADIFGRQLAMPLPAAIKAGHDISDRIRSGGGVAP